VLTYEELGKYVGKNEPGKYDKVYVGIKDKIYDVSKNEVYREGGGYYAFAGKDASVALAKMKFDKELMDPA
jgi:predicted heme/steroid binding protein